MVSLRHLIIPKQKINEDNIELFKAWHCSVFAEVLQIVPPILKADFEASDRDYIIVPVVIDSIENETVIGDLNYDLLLKMDGIGTPQQQTPPTQCYENTLVYTKHRDSTLQTGLKELFQATIDEDTTPLSPFATNQFKNYKEFYSKKYQCQISDDNQSSLKCYRVSMSYLKLFAARYSSLPKPLTTKDCIILFPELVAIFPVPADMFKILRCVPTLLWRLESLLLMEDLSKMITEDKALSCLAFDKFLYTNTVLKGYHDAGFGTIPSQKLITGNDGISVRQLVTPPIEEIYHRGPDNGLILQALMPTGANDSINLERLESLGDAFLKLITSLYLFNSRPKHHEGKLSEARSRRISNINLFVQGRKKAIATKIQANDFNMGSSSQFQSIDRVRWIPPGYALKEAPGDSPDEVTDIHSVSPNVLNYHYHSVSDKGVADCVEALIGAYTVAGGLEGGIQLMKWLGIRIVHKDTETRSYTITSCEEPCPLLFSNSSDIFKQHFEQPEVSIRDNSGMARMLVQIFGVQHTIGYHFKEPALLVEAMTHPSYVRNRATDCYQRLEFLGDAILDYLVTCHLYMSCESYNPGQISLKRSAMVSNAHFARISVRLGLHKSVLHDSPDLFKAIGQYAAGVQESEKNKSTDDLEVDLGCMSLDDDVRLHV